MEQINEHSSQKKAFKPALAAGLISLSFIALEILDTNFFRGVFLHFRIFSSLVIHSGNGTWRASDQVMAKT